jgi:hypothetical protein
MSAVDVLRHQLGVGLKLFKARDPEPAGSLIAARTAEQNVAGSAAKQSRAETTFCRHIKAHGHVLNVLEIGRQNGGHRPWAGDAVAYDFLSVVDDGVPVDLTPHLRDRAPAIYDAIFSIDAIEYLRTPWRVAAEISRMLKPGGFTFHTTIFTTRYEPTPEDFFRFTPDGLKQLFPDLECITAEFDATEQPRDTRQRCRAADIFGGLREGWRVHYCGRKPLR